MDDLIKGVERGVLLDDHHYPELMHEDSRERRLA